MFTALRITVCMGNFPNVHYCTSKFIYFSQPYCFSFLVCDIFSVGTVLKKRKKEKERRLSLKVSSPVWTLHSFAFVLFLEPPTIRWCFSHTTVDSPSAQESHRSVFASLSGKISSKSTWFTPGWGSINPTCFCQPGLKCFVMSKGNRKNQLLCQFCIEYLTKKQTKKRLPTAFSAHNKFFSRYCTTVSVRYSHRSVKNTLGDMEVKFNFNFKIWHNYMTEFF